MIVYISNPKNSTREFLHLLNNFSQVTGYKVNSKKKSVALPYTDDKRLRKKSENQHPFLIAKNNIKYLGVTLTKEVKDLNYKKFKYLKKEIEDFRR